MKESLCWLSTFNPFALNAFTHSIICHHPKSHEGHAPPTPNQYKRIGAAQTVGLTHCHEPGISERLVQQKTTT
jgi:hypothetical protein